jgi:hypothetical protein
LLLKGPPKSGETQQARTKRIKALCEVLEEKIALRYPIFKRSVYRIFRPAMPEVYPKGLFGSCATLHWVVASLDCSKR